MRKVFALCLLGSFAVVLLVCGGDRSTAQERPTPIQFGFESDSMSMADIAQMLEQFGNEMQQNGSVTYRGEAYSFTGYGGIEFSLNRRADREGNLRTGFEVGFRDSGSGEQGLETGGAYYETGITGPPAQVADYLDDMVANLASSGTLQLDFHTGEFVGSAIVDQRLIERTPPEGGRGGNFPFSLETFVTFGEGEVERHDDDEDFAEDLEANRIAPLGITETVGADQAAVAEVFSSLATSLRSGTIRGADGEAQWSDSVRFRIAHLAPGEGGSHKIESVLQFGPLPPRPSPAEAAAAREAGPRYYVEEAGGTPMAEFASMLQRIAAEILEDGTFMLDGQEFTVGDTLRGGEISFNANGIGIEVGWNPPGSG